ncbi:hypothetical protein AAV35_14255 (plasmid) [Salimicrobium jeotgali]|uniref:Type I restriction/modification specificity protein n=1 Tax=Salimicrobium jeotgali TaxID=1230341 RepID=K2GKE3_9BACI|nr:restriction endonuclease subunit S [Salimicrobium jeotgali]APC65620.1 hypothetical protein AAV35_14255 [Salimicrobium jeotgali]EKE30894.1 type I restriction/modification specificity protein [Salimicrobium jeotgali]MBM7697584.1 type I restriction enzyme S subunit [Salimicrobium jeotgali]
MKYELKDLIESISQKHSFSKDRVIFLNTSDVVDGKILHNTYSSTSELPGQAKKTIKEKDILFSEIRPKNKRFVLVEDLKEPVEDYVVSTKLMVIRVKDSHVLNQKFLYYYLTEKRIIDYLQNSAESRSGTFPQITFDDIKHLSIELPTIDKQMKIVNTIESFTKKLETNNQIISNLEQLAQTLFKRWFIDFEFPNEDGKPYRSSGGKMVESELGLIPEGWEVLILEDISESPIVCGKTPSTKIKENYGSEMPFITIPDMHNSTFIQTTEKYLSKKGAESQPKKTLPPLSICVSCIATPGLVSITSEKSQTNQQINSLIPSKVDVFYTYLYLSRKSQLIRELGSGGSTTLNLNKTQFSKVPILYPSQSIREEFHQQISPLFNEINNLQKQSFKLAQLRDNLLPKLLSGELELNEETEVTENVGVQ